MTDERLPDGPNLDEMLQQIRDAFPDAVVATIDSAAFFSMGRQALAQLRDRRLDR